MDKIGIKYQYASRAVCAYADDFLGKRPGCAFIGASVIIRTNTVFNFVTIHVACFIYVYSTQTKSYVSMNVTDRRV